MICYLVLKYYFMETCYLFDVLYNTAGFLIDTFEEARYFCAR